MGGHGALTIAIKNKESYRSVSAFSPICNPMNCAWGQNAFSKYLGDDRATWAEYDACELLKKYGPLSQGDGHILIDQGNDDEFLQQGQLLPEAFQAACDEVGQPVQIRMHVSGEPSSETAWVGMLPHSLHSFHVWCLQDGYDHSYYFIQTHLGDHIEFHAEVLSQE